LRDAIKFSRKSSDQARGRAYGLLRQALPPSTVGEVTPGESVNGNRVRTTSPRERILDTIN
jgi:hypothetical protein